MNKTANHLSESARQAIVDSLNTTLVTGIDLYNQIKVAHWNLKGPNFAAIHPLLDTFASALLVHNDAIAERAVILGGVAKGATRYVGANSTLAEYPDNIKRDLEHAKLVADRIAAYLTTVRATRSVGEKHADVDTVDLLTGVVSEFEKNAWFLYATAEG